MNSSTTTGTRTGSETAGRGGANVARLPARGSASQKKAFIYETKKGTENEAQPTQKPLPRQTRCSRAPYKRPRKSPYRKGGKGFTGQSVSAAVA
ncbi:hypothetical protein GCM10027345_14910 [Hymenobacter daeguensis]